jgi:ribosomal protein S18 acetylase RimI-like enzyme
VDPATIVVEPVRADALAGELLEALYDVYCDALELDHEAATALLWRDETIPKHASRRDFAFLVAREHGDVIGFAYGYSGDFGQWWTDRVATSVDDQLRSEWLDPPHFEVCELHVRPDRQRLGVGARLLAELLAAQPHDRVLLTANPAKAQPLPFYRKHGWQELADITFGEGYPRYVLLGKRLG